MSFSKRPESEEGGMVQSERREEERERGGDKTETVMLKDFSIN